MYSQSSEPKLQPKTKLHHNLYNSQKTHRLRRQKLKIHVSKFQQFEHSQQLCPKDNRHQYSSEGQKSDILKNRYKLNKGQPFNKLELKGILQMHFMRQKKQELKKSYLNHGYKKQGYSFGFQKKSGLDMIIPSFQAFNINSDRLPGFNDPLENDNNRSSSKNSKNDRPKSNTRQIRGIKRQEDKKYFKDRSETHKEIKLTQNQQQKQEREERERQQFTLKSFGTQIFWNKKKQISKELYTQFSMYQKKQQTKFRSKNIENIIRRKANRSFFESFAQYCRRMKVNQNSKVFVFQSSDVWLKQVLLERGWVQNLDPASKFYHLKWVNKIPLQKAEKQQLVNHFYDSDLLTSKVNLAKTIKKSKYLQKYSPRTYELGHQTSQFVINYNRTQILSGLKLIVKEIQRIKLVPINIIPKSELKDRLIKLIQSQDFQQTASIQEFVIHIPYAIQLCAFCQNLRCQGENQQKQPEFELTQKSLKNLSSFSHLNPPYIQYVNLSSTDTKEKKEERIKLNKKNINMYSSALSFKCPSRELLCIVYSYHKYLCADFKTYEAEGPQNIWIVKNRNSSKGGGISIYNNFQDILKKTDNKIVQKYLQNCALFGDKNKGKQVKYYKYDLRVWVLVTSYSPLIAYYYNNFYCRLCSEEYNTKNISKLQSHLTNYSKNRQNFTQNRCSVLSYQQFINLGIKHQIANEQAQKEIGFEGQAQQEEYYKNIKSKVIKKVDEKLQLLIFHTLSMYQDRIQSCPECFQLYGFDILVSDTFEFYLIEVNLSPACEDRDEWLSQNARRMARGMINIVAQHQKPQDSRFQGWSIIKSI